MTFEFVYVVELGSSVHHSELRFWNGLGCRFTATAEDGGLPIHPGAFDRAGGAELEEWCQRELSRRVGPIKGAGNGRYIVYLSKDVTLTFA
jgi:hypothetical protein